jgi:hypothetical protein
MATISDQNKRELYGILFRGQIVREHLQVDKLVFLFDGVRIPKCAYF